MVKDALLDTNVVIGFLTGELPSSSVSSYFGHVPKISVISEIELLSGTRVTSEEKMLINSFLSIAEVYRHINREISEKTAEIRRTYKLKTPDAIIAATAVVHGLSLVT